MTAYKIELFLHIAAVIVVFGLTFAYPFLQSAAERAGTGATKFALGVMARTDTLVVTPGAILVLILGAALMGNDHHTYDKTPVWLMVAVVIFVVAFATAFFVQRPTVRRARALLEKTPDNAPLPADYAPLSKQMQMVGGMLGLAVLVIAFLMVYKPGQ